MATPLPENEGHRAQLTMPDTKLRSKRTLPAVAEAQTPGPHEAGDFESAGHGYMGREERRVSTPE